MLNTIAHSRQGWPFTLPSVLTLGGVNPQFTTNVYQKTRFIPDGSRLSDGACFSKGKFSQCGISGCSSFLVRTDEERPLLLLTPSFVWGNRSFGLDGEFSSSGAFACTKEL